MQVYSSSYIMEYTIMEYSFLLVVVLLTSQLLAKVSLLPLLCEGFIQGGHDKRHIHNAIL